jgi:hypothetical protein
MTSDDSYSEFPNKWMNRKGSYTRKPFRPKDSYWHSKIANKVKIDNSETLFYWRGLTELFDLEKPLNLKIM